MEDARALTGDEEEIDDHLDGGRIVAWFRVDPTPRLIRALVFGAVGMTFGSLVMALSFAQLGHAPIDFTDQSSLGVAFAALGLGLTVIVGGGLVAIVGLREVLAEERYLALRTDGAYFRDGAERALIDWADVETVFAEGDRVVFARHDGSRWVRAERFAGADAEAVAKRCSEVRRKALFGLL